MIDEYRRANRALWNNWTALHATSSYYDVAGFKAGKSTLTPIEIDEIGDVAGKSLFFIVEHYPFASIFDDSVEGDLRAARPYFGGREPGQIESYGSYAVSSDEFQGMEYGWAHPLSEVVNALLAAGLRLESLHEFPYSDFPSLPNMERGDDGWWQLPGKNRDMIPLLYSLKATKPGAAGGR